MATERSAWKYFPALPAPPGSPRRQLSDVCPALLFDRSPYSAGHDRRLPCCSDSVHQLWNDLIADRLSEDPTISAARVIDSAVAYCSTPHSRPSHSAAVLTLARRLPTVPACRPSIVPVPTKPESPGSTVRTP